MLNKKMPGLIQTRNAAAVLANGLSIFNPQICLSSKPLYSPLILYHQATLLRVCVWCQIWFCPVDLCVSVERWWQGSWTEWWSEPLMPFSSDHTLLCNRLMSEQQQHWDVHKGQHQSSGLFICLGPLPPKLICSSYLFDRWMYRSQTLPTMLQLQ